jgi:arginase
VVGGDCAVLVGALAAAKECFGRVGLAFVDGHLDFFGGDTSPSGEAADTDLAFVTGYSLEGLVDLGGGTPPIVAPGDVTFKESVTEGVCCLECTSVSTRGH